MKALLRNAFLYLSGYRAQDFYAPAFIVVFGMSLVFLLNGLSLSKEIRGAAAFVYIFCSALYAHGLYLRSQGQSARLQLLAESAPFVTLTSVKMTDAPVRGGKLQPPGSIVKWIGDSSSSGDISSEDVMKAISPGYKSSYECAVATLSSQGDSFTLESSMSFGSGRPRPVLLMASRTSAAPEFELLAVDLSPVSRVEAIKYCFSTLGSASRFSFALFHADGRSWFFGAWSGDHLAVGPLERPDILRLLGVQSPLRLEEEIALSLRDRSGGSSIFRWLDKDGQPRVAQLSSTPVYEDDGSFIGIACSLSDISDTLPPHSGESASRDAHDQVRFIGHALRGPSTNVAASTEALMKAFEDGGDSRMGPILAVCERSILQLRKSVESVLCYLRSLVIEPEIGEVDAHAVACTVALSFAASTRIGDRRIEMVDSPKIICMADLAALTDAFERLVENAVVHTPAGTTITIRVTSDANSCIMVVEDDGPGVPNEFMHKITEPFAKHLSSPDAATHHGCGLGVPTALALVSAMGGGLSFHYRDPRKPSSRGLRVELRVPLAS